MIFKSLFIEVYIFVASQLEIALTTHLYKLVYHMEIHTYSLWRSHYSLVQVALSHGDTHIFTLTLSLFTCTSRLVTWRYINIHSDTFATHLYRSVCHNSSCPYVHTYKWCHQMWGCSPGHTSKSPLTPRQRRRCRIQVSILRWFEWLDTWFLQRNTYSVSTNVFAGQYRWPTYCE